MPSPTGWQVRKGGGGGLRLSVAGWAANAAEAMPSVVTAINAAKTIPRRNAITMMEPLADWPGHPQAFLPSVVPVATVVHNHPPRRHHDVGQRRDWRYPGREGRAVTLSLAQRAFDLILLGLLCLVVSKL